MTYEVYRYIFFGGAILSFVLLIIAVILFFKFEISKVIGDLTGVNRKKAIAEFKNQNRNSDKNFNGENVGNRSKNQSNDNVSKLKKFEHNNKNVGVHEQVVEEDGEYPVYTKQETSEKKGKTIKLENMRETTVLNNIDSSMMMGISQSDSFSMSQEGNSDMDFEIMYEITLLHTEEVI